MAAGLGAQPIETGSTDVGDMPVESKINTECHSKHSDVIFGFHCVRVKPQSRAATFQSRKVVP